MQPQQQTAMFSVMGMTGPESIETIEAALRPLDAAARVRGFLSQQMVQVTTAASPDAVIAAMEAAGFAAALTDRPAPRPSAFTAGAVGRVVGRAILWALAWALLLPILTLILVSGIAYLDPTCGGPGDSGGCAMGIFSITLSAVPVGAALGFLITLARGVWKIHRARE